MDKPRSLAQNRSLHKFFDQVAQVLAEHGVTLTDLLTAFRQDPPPPKGNNIKDIWRNLQKDLFSKQSTTEITSKEMNELYEYFHKTVAELTGESIEFPSEEIRQLLNYYK